MLSAFRVRDEIRQIERGRCRPSLPASEDADVVKITPLLDAFAKANPEAGALCPDAGGPEGSRSIGS